MNIFDIMGPVMVGPSSSHTAGGEGVNKVTYRCRHVRYTEGDCAWRPCNHSHGAWGEK